MTGTRATIEDLEARHVAHLRACREPATVRANANTGWRNNPLESAHVDDIQIDATHRVLIPASEGLAGRLWLIVGALIAASGWVVISVLPLPFASVPVDKQRASSAASADASGRKSDRLQVATAVVGGPAPTGSREMSAIAVAATQSQPQSSTEAQQQRTEQVNKTPHHTASIKAKVRESEPPVQLSPAPETRPTTIEGWTLRDVTNGTAVWKDLMAPGGRHAATRYQDWAESIPFSNGATA